MVAAKGLRVQMEAEKQGGPADLGSSEKWPLKQDGGGGNVFRKITAYVFVYSF